MYSWIAILELWSVETDINAYSYNKYTQCKRSINTPKNIFFITSPQAVRIVYHPYNPHSLRWSNKKIDFCFTALDFFKGLHCSFHNKKSVPVTPTAEGQETFATLNGQGLLTIH